MITSKDNPHIKNCIKLRDDKRERSRTRRFFAEGENMIRAAADAGVPIHVFLFTEQARARFGDLVDRVAAVAQTSLEVSPELAGKLSDAKTPQGLFAVLNFMEETEDLTALPDDARVVFLENLQDPGNLGTILRTALAFSIDCVVLCGCCDLYSPKVLRSTAGMIFQVPFCRQPEPISAVKKLKEAGFAVLGTSLHGDPEPIRQAFGGKNKYAVVIGNEGSGVTEDLLAKCDGQVCIPMSAQVESLNASVAAAICMWEMKGRERS